MMWYTPILDLPPPNIVLSGSGSEGTGFDTVIMWQVMYHGVGRLYK